MRPNPFVTHGVKYNAQRPAAPRPSKQRRESQADLELVRQTNCYGGTTMRGGWATRDGDQSAY